MIDFKGSHFEREVILWAVRWYVGYPISYRQLEEMMEEHGVEVDHAGTAWRLGVQRAATVFSCLISD
jgi:transposase-like protein